MFKLTDDFISQYKNKQPKWGPIGYFVYKRTYARQLANKKSEEFWQTIQRVVEGIYELQHRHCKSLNLPWSSQKAQFSAQEMYRRIWDFKFLPSGRGLWALNTDYMWNKGAMCLYNCAAISTKDLKHDPVSPFTFVMDSSMLGVGVGCDLKGADIIIIKKPKLVNVKYSIEDSREGWIDSLRILLEAYFCGNDLPELDFSQIREKGAPIKTFGGVAPGPEPLIMMHVELKKIFERKIGQLLNSVDLVDIFNIIGKCVVSGGVRRTALLMLGELYDREYLDMKNPTKYKTELENHRWASNNSIYAYRGSNYNDIISGIQNNGEPGVIWIDNLQSFGRMNGIDMIDDNYAWLVNPCAEITLENGECCNLVETFPANHDNPSDYIKTLKYAYLYSKSITLLPTHIQSTNAVLMKNRRIGISQSGIIQAINKFGRFTLLHKFCDAGYLYLRQIDEIYSNWLCIPKSKKLTTIKPSGTLSLLTGATPGIHYPHSEFYIRRVRINDTSELLESLAAAGFKMEPDKYAPNTLVVEFPIKEQNFIKSKNDVTMWEQLLNAAEYQKFWADNNVSVTITFKQEEAADIKSALEIFENKLKAVSFLPHKQIGYEQMPYESITENTYAEMVSKIDYKQLYQKSKNISLDGIGEKYCDGDRCVL